MPLSCKWLLPQLGTRALQAGTRRPAERVAALDRDLHITGDEYDTAQRVAAFATTAQRQFP